MSLKRRLVKLERRRGKGRCPGCGFLPDDVRTIEIGRSPTRAEMDARAQAPPLVEWVAGEIEQPGRARCAACGGYMPPLAFVELPEGDP